MDYHLSYSAEEDRLLVSIDVAPEQEYAMSMTRRLTKQLLASLADLQANRRSAAIGGNPMLRDTVLNFEHASAVADAVSSGEARKKKRNKALVASPRLVQEVQITPKEDGGVVLRIDDKARMLTLDLTQQRAHAFMAGVLDLAAGAGWDLPVIATWLDRSGASDAAPGPKVLH